MVLVVEQQTGAHAEYGMEVINGAVDEYEPIR
jgi:hypothetical protein